MKKLHKGIIAIQTRVDILAKKGGRNTVGRGYDYFTETDLYNALKPLMKEYGIGYSIGFTTYNERVCGKDQNMVAVSGLGYLELFHEEEDDIKRIDIVYAATNTDNAKAIGSALTYMKRYWLCKEFGIPTEELDPDNTENSKKVAEANKAAPVVKVDPVKEGLVQEIVTMVKTAEHQTIVRDLVGAMNLTNLRKQTMNILAELKRRLGGTQ